jgi:all-trans-8'-apo-beta-carotenal 15,15'-oxygenase
MYVHIDNAFEDRGVFDPARDFRAASEIGGFASRLRITKGDKVTIVDVSEQGGSTLLPRLPR